MYRNGVFSDFVTCNRMLKGHIKKKWKYLYAVPF